MEFARVLVCWGSYVPESFLGSAQFMTYCSMNDTICFHYHIIVHVRQWHGNFITSSIAQLARSQLHLTTGILQIKQEDATTAHQQTTEMNPPVNNCLQHRNPTVPEDSHPDQSP